MNGVSLKVGHGAVFRTVRVSYMGVDVGDVSRLRRCYDRTGKRTGERHKPQWKACGVGAELATKHERRGDAIRALVVRAMARVT